MQEQPRKRRNFVAPLITMLSSIVLGYGSCYGFLSTLSFHGAGRYEALNILFFVAFWLCVLVFLATLVWIIVRALRNAQSGQESKERRNPAN